MIYYLLIMALHLLESLKINNVLYLKPKKGIIINIRALLMLMTDEVLRCDTLRACVGMEMCTRMSERELYVLQSHEHHHHHRHRHCIISKYSHCYDPTHPHTHTRKSTQSSRAFTVVRACYFNIYFRVLCARAFAPVIRAADTTRRRLLAVRAAPHTKYMCFKHALLARGALKSLRAKLSRRRLRLRW